MFVIPKWQATITDIFLKACLKYILLFVIKFLRFVLKYNVLDNFYTHIPIINNANVK